MHPRSPARFLAPLALFVCVLAVFLIVKPASDDSPATSGTTSTATASTTSTAAKKPKPSKKQPKTYTVQSGDTLSGIAEQTGVPVEDLQQFNPGVDANSMRVGQKLKLAG